MIEQKQAPKTHVGSVAIECASELFEQGYQEGYTYFRENQAGKPISSQQIYSFLAARITNVLQQDEYKAGFVAGWITAFHAPHLTILNRLPDDVIALWAGEL